MACGVALKRSMDLDGLHSPDHGGIKRRRTSNVCHHAPYQPAASGFAPTQPQQQPADRQSTIFDVAANNARFSTDDLYSALRRQLRSSLRRRRAAQNVDVTAAGDSSPSDSSDSERSAGAGMEGCPPTPRRQQQATLTTKARDAPLFSFGQVHQICDRLLKEQETRLTQEYEKILNAKMAEQYDSFVRFTYDQIHRRFDETSMSYLS